MIHHSLFLVLYLLAVESGVLYAAGHQRFKRYFQFLPGVFWIYFLPMLSSTLGLIDSQSPVYQRIITNLLPASLFLLLISVDIRAILKLSRPAVVMMLAGSFGIMLGTVLVFFFFKEWVGGPFWSGFGALSASWTGGSANMIAVREAMATPDEIFLPMVIVDTIVPYVWMGLLVTAAVWQKGYDRWNRSDRSMLNSLEKTMDRPVPGSNSEWRLHNVLLILGSAFLGGSLCRYLAGLLPEIPQVISASAWTIILVSTCGLLLSLTPARRLEKQGASRIGYFLLYFVLTAIGAKASLVHLGSTVILIAAGFLIVAVHAVILFLASRWMKTPLFLAAVASQANIGGVASAPIVAEIYQPGFASVGLLLAIMGNIMGTYLGILTAQLCRWMAG